MLLTTEFPADVPAETPKPPRRVDRYRITGLLTHGGMGELWRGLDELDRPVVLKRLLPDYWDSAPIRERFRREAMIACRLGHANLVETYDSLEVDGCDWIVMEWVKGRSLDRVLAEGVLSFLRAATLGGQLAEALGAMHREGLIHRDIKPANIMVLHEGSPKESVKLLDFGLAKPIAGHPASADLRSDGDEQQIHTDLTAEGLVPGTLAWMSPEQAMGSPIGASSDLFSLGALLYAMLTGASPFGGHSHLETLRRVCMVRETPLLDQVPETPLGLAKLIDRLLDKEPQNRPDAEEVSRSLEQVSEIKVEGC